MIDTIITRMRRKIDIVRLDAKARQDVLYGPYTAPTVELLMFLDGSGATVTEDGIIIPTLEGDHLARVGDYIIRGVAGEFYPCKPDIFEKTYEAVLGDAP